MSQVLSNKSPFQKAIDVLSENHLDIQYQLTAITRALTYIAMGLLEMEDDK